MERKTKTKISEVIDSETGEILNSTSELIHYKNEPDFVKLYLKDVFRLYEISGGGNKVINALLPKMNYENEIVLTGQMKIEMAKKLNIAKNTFEHSIGEIVNKGILLKIGNNHYLFNPNIYARGSWSDIQQLRLTVTYSQAGKLIKTEPDFQKSIDFK